MGRWSGCRRRCLATAEHPRFLPVRPREGGIMILVTGASGTVGGAVLNEVALNGVRAMYRSKSDAAKAPKNVEVVIADFADTGSLAPALEGIESVFIVCGPIPQLVELESNMIDASRTAGVHTWSLVPPLGPAASRSLFPVGTGGSR